ncbi:MAG TPA: histidinol-phosphate transaminase [Candidatus Sulfotelmatobacter sp.]
MSRFFDLVSKPAREMGLYTPVPSLAAQATEAASPRLIKLDSNENPFGPSPRAVEAMRHAVSSSNFYPEDDCNELRHTLAAYHDLPADQIMVTAGSTALLSLLCQTLLAPRLNAVTSERSFIVYSLAVQAAGADLIEAPMRENTFDPGAILDAIDKNTRLVFLANPNNPTGTILGAAVIDKFLARVPANVVVVLDEAYYEFAAHFASIRGTNYSRSVEYVRQGAGVVVLRTFSKAHGLAGLRIGFGMGPAELLAYCAHLRNTFSVSSVAQAAAVAALNDQNHLALVVANNATQAAVLEEALTAMGLSVTPTYANFLYCELGENAAPFVLRLRDEGVSVRPLGPWGAPNAIRVTVGTPEQNDFFLRTMRTMVTQPAAGISRNPTTQIVQL